MRFAVVLLCIADATATRAHQPPATTVPHYVISGHVVDPERLRSDDDRLMLGQERDGSFSAVPVPIEADGSFVTSPVRSGTYVIEMVRGQFAVSRTPKTVAFTIVRVGTGDVSGVTVEVRRDTAITGRFRMESDNPDAQWPTQIIVNASVALEGMPILKGTTADGAPDGKFVLRNAFGPRVLRCGYTLAGGSWWWPSQVMLDGKDITNVPTDFSALENGHLEVVFAQQPARIAGVVTDAQGQPVRAPWIVVVAADRSLWQQWATTSEVTQGNTTGAFSLAALPGRYLVTALPQNAFSSWQAARQGILRFAQHGVPVDLRERERTDVKLVVQER